MDNQPVVEKKNSFNIKKLIFAPIFLIVFAFFCLQLGITLAIPNLALSFGLSTLIQLLVLTAVTMLASLFFVVFAVLAFDWRVVGPLSLLASILFFIFFTPLTGLIGAMLILALLCSIYLMLEQKLKSYLDFKPTVLFKSSIKNLAWFLILISALAYYFVISNDISKNGFALPDSLIDTSLKFMPASTTLEQTPQLPQIPPEQLDALKKNPQLLKQYGLDPNLLDQYSKQQSATPPATESPVKKLIKEQLQTMIKPYERFIAPVLAILFYFSLTFFLSIFSIFISPLVWLTFWILRKSGFIKFVEEQRTIKKMVT